MFRFAGFELDLQRAELRGSDRQAIKLRPKTFDMLRLFVANAGRVLSKRELMEGIWPNIHVGEDSLFQCIREIRTALGDDRREMIKLVSGRGYIFAAEVLDGPAETAAVPESTPPETTPPETTASPIKRLSMPGWRLPIAAALAGLCTVIGFAVAAPNFVQGLVFKPKPPALAVLPIVGAGRDPDAALMAANVTGSLTDGLASVGGIRVVTPPSAAAIQPASMRVPAAELELTGELQKTASAWELRARLTRSATREVVWTTSVSVNIDGSDVPLQQSRLTAGLGHRLAQTINAKLNADSSSRSARIVVEQAKATINQTSRERFTLAQTMLERALAENPDSVDLQVALAAHVLRGIQMTWYEPAVSATMEAQAQTLLRQALRAKPDYLPVHEAHCRFLGATNNFADALVACAGALAFDPWNGLLLYNLGLAQLKLGRFEDALATFIQADRYDTPEVSRWTWLLGAGWANMLMNRDQAALPWLQRSIAITPATGRSHLLLAAAYQRLGRADEAKAALAQTLSLRPGSTARNISPPQKNTSPRYLEAGEQILRAGIAAGLPED